MREQLRTLVAEMVRHGVTLEAAMREFERIYLQEVLEANGGNQSAAARKLGIHRNTLSRKLEPPVTTIRKASLAS
jgi:DNA-binding NtrC family response regulator